MITQKLGRKTIAYLLIGLTASVGLIHVWHPITISPASSGERSGFATTVLLFSWFMISGYRFARIGVGVTFVFFAFINLLIALAYVRNVSVNSLEIGFWILTLGILGYSLLCSQSIRVFEENRQKQHPANS